jgi:uncharacterized protein
MTHTRLIPLLMLALACALPAAAQYQSVQYPPKPGEREFISDNTSETLLTPAQADELRKELDQLLTEKAIPIIVVTIDSMAKYNASGMQIETYARMLFDNWGIGHKQIEVRGRGVGRKRTMDWNKGILLLISVGDQKARIELGDDFGRTKDAQCSQIMQTHIIPFFKRNDYSGGIMAGVRALIQMARDETIEAPPRPMWHYLVIAGAICLAIFTFTSLARRGSSGWAWLFWGVVFSIVGALLYHMLTSRGGRSGGFSGGSFGGGFSGGGGATGSW